MLHIFCAAVPQFWPFQHDINVAFIASTVSGGESLKGWAGMKIPALFFCAQHGSLQKSLVFSLFLQRQRSMESPNHTLSPGPVTARPIG
jgi:hypothetical protein